MTHIKLFAHGKWETAMGTFNVPVNAYLKFFAGHGGFSLAHETRDFERMDMAAGMAAGATVAGHLTSLSVTSSAALVGETTYRRTVYSPNDVVANYRLTKLGIYSANNLSGWRCSEVSGPLMPIDEPKMLAQAVSDIVTNARFVAPYAIYCFFCRESGDKLPGDAS